MTPPDPSHRGHVVLITSPDAGQPVPFQNTSRRSQVLAHSRNLFRYTLYTGDSVEVEWNAPLLKLSQEKIWDLEAHTEVSTLSSLLKGVPQRSPKITEVTKDIVNVSTSCLCTPLHALVTITVVEVSFSASPSTS